MIIFNIIISALTGDIESILILMPIFFIIIFIVYIIKNNIKNIFKNVKIIKFKKDIKPQITKPSINYKLKLKEIKESKNPKEATEKLLALINVFLSEFFKAEKILTYEELAKLAKKKNLPIISSFCRKVSLASFSTEDIEKKEFNSIIKDFKFILNKYQKKEIKIPQTISLSRKLQILELKEKKLLYNKFELMPKKLEQEFKTSKNNLSKQITYLKRKFNKVNLNFRKKQPKKLEEIPKLERELKEIKSNESNRQNKNEIFISEIKELEKIIPKIKENKPDEEEQLKKEIEEAEKVIWNKDLSKAKKLYIDINKRYDNLTKDKKHKFYNKILELYYNIK